MLAADHIVLIGFMGTGKSVVGQAVAAQLSLDFCDLDLKIAASFGDISTLFKNEGELYFRQREYELFTIEAAKRPQLISTGGGIITHQPSLDMLKQQPQVVWLRATFDTVMHRIQNDVGNSRPLADDGIKDRFDSRQATYNEVCDIVIDVDELSIQEVAEKIINRYG